MVRSPSLLRSSVTLVSALAVTAATACGTSGGGPVGSEPAAAEPTTSESTATDATGQAATSAADPVSEHSTTLDGLERTWTTYSPGGSHPAEAPVLLVIHGTGDTGSGIRRGIGPDFERLADEHGFTVAYVDGHQNNWNECRVEGDWPAKEEDLDDVGLMREVVDELGAHGPVYAVGFSSGGHMAMRLALEAPDLVDGVAPVAANPPVPDNQACVVADDPVPMMFVQGREDSINPVEGGEVTVGSGPFASSRGEVLSAVDGAEWFAERNGVADGPAPSAERDGDTETTTWEGADPVRLVTVDHVGHSFPTTSGRWGGDDGARYDAPGEIWRFFTED